MTVTKFDFTDSTQDIFYKVIYPLCAEDFMFGQDYEYFAAIVQARFILNPVQWEYILQHWEEKENRRIV